MFEGKIAVITGGSRGIGLAIGRKLAQGGATIAIVDISGEEVGQQAVNEIKAFGVDAEIFQCNVCDFEACKTLVENIINRFGGIDILVNNAGITRDSLMLAMKESDFDSVVAVSLKGTFNLIRHAMPNMMKRRNGRIINIASVVGLTGNAGQANYSAAKAGIIGLTKTVAKELGSRGVTCNAIAPGYIQTLMTDALSDKAKEAFLTRIPLARAGTPEDVAETVAFLASNSAAYITGEVIRVDGGLAM